VDLISIENVEKYKGIFGKKGDRKVSPTELYNIYEVPKEMHPIFTIKPFDPIVSQEMKQINSEARAKADKELSEKGFNVFDISTSIRDITVLFDDVQVDGHNEKECSKIAVVLLGNAKKQYNDKNNLKSIIEDFDESWGETEKGDNYNFSKLLILKKRFERVADEDQVFYSMARDLGRVFDIVIAHTAKVEQYFAEGENGLEDLSGDFTQATLYTLQDSVRNWLDRKLQEESTLSYTEILGL